MALSAVFYVDPGMVATFPEWVEDCQQVLVPVGHHFEDMDPADVDKLQYVSARHTLNRLVERITDPGKDSAAISDASLYYLHAARFNLCGGLAPGMRPRHPPGIVREAMERFAALRNVAPWWTLYPRPAPPMDPVPQLQLENQPSPSLVDPEQTPSVMDPEQVQPTTLDPVPTPVVDPGAAASSTLDPVPTPVVDPEAAASSHVDPAPTPNVDPAGRPGTRTRTRWNQARFQAAVDAAGPVELSFPAMAERASRAASC